MLKPSSKCPAVFFHLKINGIFCTIKHMKENEEQFSLPKMEERILEFWEKNKIFEKSVERREGVEPFVFYEGPPTANGTPGVHHVESRTFKDIILRYKTMRGYFVPRRAGWDTHGLPVEIEVEKILGLKSKKDIEKYGIAEFNKKCRESVWKYKELWERLTARMGFWIDMANAYVTYANEYIETLWWIIKQFADKGYLYEDYKVVPWCARCGTALSSHELAQGYEKIKEESVYIKFEIRNPKFETKSKFQNPSSKTYFLAWTTTPWTLPGNVALAVNPKAQYIVAEKNSDVFVLAKARADIFGEFKILKEIKGSDLVGGLYKSLYPLKNDAAKISDKEKTYVVIGGDFVSLDDGTGIVHIAPAFGDDDFRAGKKNNLSVVSTTDECGMMQTQGYSWNGKFFKDANQLIVEDLKSRELLFKTEIYEHDYPFCWRCKTPLMYFARKTWWVAVNKVRKELLANNETINWYPDYLKHGRFGGWLKEEKDWAFSRERYWGTPLPVWRCGECNAWEAIGSIAEIKEHAVVSRNRYIVMRHGEAECNVKNIVNSSLDTNHFGITEKGKKQVAKSIVELKSQKITPEIIVASPFLRAQETARMAADALDLLPQNVNTDTRLSEINTGIFDGKDVSSYHAFYNNQLIERFTKAPAGGETMRDVIKRAGSLFSELENKYQDKTILLVGHEYVCWALWVAAHAATNEEAITEKTKRGNDFIKTAEFEKLEFLSLPRDEIGNLDLHKPYIDAIKLKCKKCGGMMTRVPEVVDVWFDSGAMPFAQAHYPFVKKMEYPADYIVEAVDQTRGWFYNLLAVGTLLGLEAPYRNVISLGHVLDVKGKKMSKSLGNVVDPMMLLEKYGADSVRWYFFTINQPWDSKLFDEKGIIDASRRFFMILWNCFQFFRTYGKIEGSDLALSERRSHTLIINQWILIRLNDLAGDVAKKMDSYDIVGAAREIENFVVEDLSRWYVRRIRAIMRDDSLEAQETSTVLRHILLEIAKLLAPFAPFISEEIYCEIGAGKESVHLEDYPLISNIQPLTSNLLEDMEEVRKIVALALEARAKAGIKVRQPLSGLTLNTQHSTLNTQLLNLIKEEANIKEIKFDSALENEVVLDTKITDELHEEGILRDLIREIQQKRKEAGLKPNDSVKISLKAPPDIVSVLKRNKDQLHTAVNADNIAIEENDLLVILFE